MNLNAECDECKTAIKLAGLWTATMFLYVYADITHFVLQTGSLEDIISGAIEGVEITPLFLFGTAVLMSIPSVMIVVSLGANPRVARWLNITIGALFTLMSGSTAVVPGDTWLYYRYYNLIEAILTGLVVWVAWRWHYGQQTTSPSSSLQQLS
jgi:hypothetical protein